MVPPPIKNTTSLTDRQTDSGTTCDTHPRSSKKNLSVSHTHALSLSHFAPFTTRPDGRTDAAPEIRLSSARLGSALLPPALGTSVALSRCASFLLIGEVALRKPGEPLSACRLQAWHCFALLCSALLPRCVLFSSCLLLSTLTRSQIKQPSTASTTTTLLLHPHPPPAISSPPLPLALFLPFPYLSPAKIS